MASSKIMTTTSRTNNTDLPCQPSICSSLSSLLGDFRNQDQNSGDPQTLGTMNMDDLLKNIYSTPTPTPEQVVLNGASMTREGSLVYNDKNNGDDNKLVDEMWKQIVEGGSHQRRGGVEEERMTLEDFLTKAGAVREDDLRAYGNNTTTNNNNDSSTNNKNDTNQMATVGLGGERGRGKRRPVEEPPMDKATQQKQRRMIKNRESAARSRERKQAYTVELESLVMQLEEENARLVREEAEQNKERFKQLMENLIPVIEKRRPPRVLRRVHSLHW